MRLDAFASTANAVYDVEIQAYTMKELGRRMRYYQSAMDSSALRRGQPYRNLAESYVVFICTEDQFDAALPVYHFEMVCCEDEAVDLRHGFHWVVLNASAWETLAEGPLRSLLKYVAAGEEVAMRLWLMLQRREARNGNAVWRQKGLDMLTYIEDARIQAELIS